MRIVSRVLRVALAVLFIMAAVPKLTGDPMAAAMVEQLGVGAWAGPAIGIAELVAAVLLLVPSTVVFGALLGWGILGGAIVSHLTVLGISLGEEDGGSMFVMAIVGFLVADGLIILHRHPLLKLLGKGE